MKLKDIFLATVFGFVFSGCVGAYHAEIGDVVIENSKMRLVIGSDAKAKSLILKTNGEEMLDAHEGIAFCSVTQTRPFNNEAKLINPNKRTTYPANRLHREGDKLVVGFVTAPYEAILKVAATDGYAVFELEGFRCQHDLQYEGLEMDVPPVDAFRLVQLPVKERKNFGNWLNVMWDDDAAVSVMAVSPFADVDHEDRFGFRLFNADLRKGLQLCGGKAAIVVGSGEKDFLDSTDVLEHAYNLPLGVESRRSKQVNASILWTGAITPDNVDEYIKIAKRSGLKMVLIYYTAFQGCGYTGLGDYTFSSKYPNGYADVKKVCDKLLAAGITPGFHTLQTHIGIESSYVTPKADPRLNLTRRFTLASPIAATGDISEISVLENPVDAQSFGKARVLKFGTELFSYTGFTDKPPYRFTGVKRGHWKTSLVSHQYGEIGGTLDVSEYCALSCYIDQLTDLQDEIGEKIAKIWDCGFQFAYFDGSEGVNPPCGIFVPYSQYRVIRKFAKQPIFVEGAAKGHFGWHLQAGGNAFDIFPPETFKKMIVRFPQTEAPMLRNDFTRLDFGWWSFYRPGADVIDKSVVPHRKLKTIGAQLDIWEFGNSRAAAWNCPVTVMLTPERVAAHPRSGDLLEMMRRWEDVRARGLLTDDWREALKSSTQEHHLYLNEKGEYELCEIEVLPSPEKANKLRAFIFERGGKTVLAYWHISGKGEFSINLDGDKKLIAENLAYLECNVSRDEVKKAYAAVVMK